MLFNQFLTYKQRHLGGSSRPAAVAIGRHPKEHGIVLVMAMIMLVVISLLAVNSMRNATSTESVLGSVRTSQLASQAAEIALSHCEYSVNDVVNSAGVYTTTFTSSNILPTSTIPNWQSTTIWDTTSTVAIYILPIASVNLSGMTSTTYLRPPECMVERLARMGSSGVITTSSSFVVTARGFGPEIPAANAGRSRPMGSVVWLQSTIQVN